MVLPFRYDYSKGVDDTSFNPWITYDGNNIDGYYNAAQDRDIWVNNGRAESSRARVWRWTLDDLRARGLDPGAADSRIVRQVYLNNVARLRRDIEAPDNAGRGLSWAGSGFQGYDRFLLNPEVAQETQAGRPAPASKGAGAPAPAPAPVPPAVPAPLPIVNPGFGGGLGSYSGTSQLSGVQRNMLADDPEQAYEYMARQLGLNPDISTRFSSYMKQRFSPILQASLAASNIGDSSDYRDVVDQLIGNFGTAMSTPGGSFFGDLRRQADSALGSEEGMGFLSGVSEQDAVMQYLNQLAVLRYAGANPMVQQSIADQLANAQESYNWEDFTRGGVGMDPYLDWLRRSKYSRYLPLR